MKERNLQRSKKAKLLKNQKESKKGCLRFSYCLFLTFVYFNILVLFWSHFSLQKYARISLYWYSRICFDFLTGIKTKNNASSCILQNGTSQGAITASAFIPIICIIFYSTALSRRVEKKWRNCQWKVCLEPHCFFRMPYLEEACCIALRKSPKTIRMSI